MSRLDVRDKTAKVKNRVAPRAADARDAAAEYADKATEKVAPRVEAAREAVVPRLESARDAVAPRLESAKETVTPHLETAREKVREDILPKVAGAAAAAFAASEPVRDEAKSRGIATIAALKGEVTPKDVRKAQRRHRGGRMRKLLLFAAVAGAGAAVWKWWKRQSEPDWSVDEFDTSSAPTMVENESSRSADVWAPSAGEAAVAGEVGGISADTGAASPDEAAAEAADSERKEETSADAWRPAH